jgi:hypothetical protein
MTTYNRYTVRERIIRRDRIIKDEETGQLLFSIHLKLFGKNRGYRVSDANGIEILRSRDNGSYSRRSITIIESSSQLQTTVHLDKNKIVMSDLDREYTIEDVKHIGRSFKLFQDDRMVLAVRRSFL